MGSRDRRVVDLLNAMPERNRYIRGLRAWVGFRQTAVDFDRPGRFAGEPKYTLTKLMKLAFGGLVAALVVTYAFRNVSNRHH